MTIEQGKEKLISWANREIGYHEGDNNYNKYAENADLQKLYGWKPQNQPWCDTFVDTGFCECFGLELASKLTYQPIGRGSAACRYSAGFYSAHDAFFDTPQIGDQAFFYVDNAINHTGIVVSVVGNAFYTVEGNSSDTVVRRRYTIGGASVAGFGRPDWMALVEDEDDPPATEPEPVTQPSTPVNPATLPCYVKLPLLKRGCKGSYVKAVQFLLNGWGASCGVYGADGDFGPATEAAVLAFQRRNGLDPDGVIGNATYSKLMGA